MPVLALHAHLAAVLEALIRAAVAEMSALLLRDEHETTTTNNNQTTPQTTAAVENEERLKKFASVMEVLGNEALGKIIKLVDETKFLLDLECKTFSGKRAKQPGSILNILSVGGLEEEHSYDGCGRNSETRTRNEAEDVEDSQRPESPLTLAVTIKDEFGNIDLKSIIAGNLELASGEGRPPEEGAPELRQFSSVTFTADTLISRIYWKFWLLLLWL
ncbi:hypothetical protein MHYP_G00158870 [Metynnis hypsauchen]